MTRALKLSKKELKKKSIVKAHHQRKLRNLLKSNGLTSVSVPSDGDCLLSATIHQLRKNHQDAPDINELRENMCNHMMEHKAHYVHYMSLSEENYNISQEFENEVNSLRKPGNWSTALGDIMPLVIANIIKKPLRLFTSIQGYPILDIYPDMHPDVSRDRDNTLLYAYTATPKTEHFDPCYKLSELLPQSQQPVCNNKLNGDDGVCDDLNVECEVAVKSNNDTMIRNELNNEVRVCKETYDTRYCDESNGKTKTDGTARICDEPFHSSWIGFEPYNDDDISDAHLVEACYVEFSDKPNDMTEFNDGVGVADELNGDTIGDTHLVEASNEAWCDDDTGVGNEPNNVARVFNESNGDADVIDGPTVDLIGEVVDELNDGGWVDKLNDGGWVDEPNDCGWVDKSNDGEVDKPNDCSVVDKSNNDVGGAGKPNDNDVVDKSNDDGLVDKPNGGGLKDNQNDGGLVDKSNDGDVIDEPNYGGLVDNLNDGDVADETNDDIGVDNLHQSRGRKRKANPEIWKKSQRKQLRSLGKEYIGVHGNKNPQRSVKNIDCTSCKFHCNEMYSDDERQQIFESYWSLGNYERQRDFICAHVREYSPKVQVVKARRHRTVSRKYLLNLDKNTPVCKKFFLATLDIGERLVSVALKKKMENSCGDQRGKHVPYNKTSLEDVNRIHSHIKSFPTMESHYTRKDTNRRYLDPSLNIRKMFNLYREECARNNVNSCSEKIYRKVFNQDFNLSFHHPKKDQCLKCEAYKLKLKDGKIDSDSKIQYDKHLENKDLAREEKKKDSEKAKSDKSYCTASFDLQSVLITPCSLVSTMYYKRKLSSYNLTIYSHGTQNGVCFVWDETQGRRGSCEIATCLLYYLRSLPTSVTHVSLYSDSCPGQNRNQFVATCLIYAVQTIPNLSTVDHKFLETGHTQMECDSIHAAIEFAKKHTPIYIPSEWHTVIRMARKKNPYVVTPLQYDDIVDFKKMTKNEMKFSKVDTEGNRLNWMHLKWLRFQKDEECIDFKYSYKDTTFKRIRFKPVTTRHRSAHNTLPGDALLTKCYKEPLAISCAKKKDLVDLCNQYVIPGQFHQFYHKLKASAIKHDKLPVPDTEETTDDSDYE